MTARSKGELPYAIVQHSGFGYGGDRQFYGGLETRPLTTKAQYDRAERAGGVVFDNYCIAEDFCEWAQYTASKVAGLIPLADRVGKFSLLTIDSLQIFMPRQGVVEAFNADPKLALPEGLLT